jgi:ribosome maturation factor RimP
VNILDLDAGLASVVDFVREAHDPIWQAITDRKEVTSTDCAVLSGAVRALLDAIDARLPQAEQPIVQAVAA